MAKTIEIASSHKGRISVKVKGESRTIAFEDKGTVGLALVDHDEAAALLAVGTDFWKPGYKTFGAPVQTLPEETKEVITESPEFKAPYATKDCKFGKWSVIDADGITVEKDLTKQAAEEKAVELNTI